MAELPAFVALRSRVADALRGHAEDIAVRWEYRSRMVASYELENRPRSAHGGVGRMIVLSLANVLASNGAASGDLITLGLTIGLDAFEEGGSVHHAVRRLDLLLAMTLHAMEQIVMDERDATVTDGVRLSRRVQQAASLLTLAAMKGYTQAMGGVANDNLRQLRHDLRNPLGTIKSVLAMLNDETIPAAKRAYPRFHAMLTRNARLLGELITNRLSNETLVPPALVWQTASLHTIAEAVRRNLRAEAAVHQVKVVSDDTEGGVTVDAVGLELVLHELVYGALQESRPGDEIRVEFSEGRNDQSLVRLYCVPTRPPCQNARILERLNAVSARMRMELRVNAYEATVLVPTHRSAVTSQVPNVVSASRPVAPADVSPSGHAPSGGGETSYDVRSARDREHGQPSTF